MRHASILLTIFLLACGLIPGAARAADPVYVGFDGEYGMVSSTSAQAIEQGIRVAMKEINDAGGVLGGRPLALLTRDNRSVPARGIENLKELAQTKDLVAVLAGRFSPVILQQLPVVHELAIPLLDVWGSADGITDHDYKPSYTFRLSLRDRLAMPTLLGHAEKRGFSKVALMVPNTGWGRSNQQAAARHTQTHPKPAVVKEIWYNWGDREFAPMVGEVLAAGAEAIIMVANDLEGAAMVKAVAALPPNRRPAIIAHWGVSGGNFVGLCEGTLGMVDFITLQTFSLHRADPRMRDRVMAVAKELFGIRDISEIAAPVGFGHAYDMVHILARAIDLAGSTDRTAVRAALTRVKDHVGLVRRYAHPFPEQDHNALTMEDVFMARYDDKGHIVPVAPQGVTP